MTDIITIVDYGMGNIGSIVNIIKKAGGKSEISSDKDVILKSKKIILPGVGSFDSGMLKLQEYGLIDVLNKKVLEDRTPILGICLGMQLMTKKSDEGMLEGFSWVDAETIKFKSVNKKFRIPHMGWNNVFKNKNHDILNNINFSESRYYFVHSFYIKCKNPFEVLLSCDYIDIFDAAFQKDNIIGVQFHPEKSHKFGLEIIKNFIKM